MTTTPGNASNSLPGKPPVVDLAPVKTLGRQGHN